MYLLLLFSGSRKGREAGSCWSGGSGWAGAACPLTHPAPFPPAHRSRVPSLRHILPDRHCIPSPRHILPDRRCVPSLRHILLDRRCVPSLRHILPDRRCVSDCLLTGDHQGDHFIDRHRGVIPICKPTSDRYCVLFRHPANDLHCLPAGLLSSDRSCVLSSTVFLIASARTLTRDRLRHHTSDRRCIARRNFITDRHCAPLHFSYQWSPRPSSFGAFCDDRRNNSSRRQILQTMVFVWSKLLKLPHRHPKNKQF